MSEPNLLFCMYFHQLRTHHAMDLLQTTNKGYWRNFGCFQAVWNCTTHVFREGDVFGFEIIKIFRHATTFFFRVRWVWESFLSCSNTCLCTKKVCVRFVGGGNKFARVGQIIHTVQHAFFKYIWAELILKTFLNGYILAYKDKMFLPEVQR